MAKTTVRFYGFTGNPVGRPLGAVAEYRATVEHDTEPDNWDRNRQVLAAIARKLTGKRSAYVDPSFGTDKRATALDRAVARNTGHVRVPTSHGEVHFQILSLTTR